MHTIKRGGIGLFATSWHILRKGIHYKNVTIAKVAVNAVVVFRNRLDEEL